ncbi:MAG: permease [Planctomycetaceae bacterium]
MAYLSEVVFSVALRFVQALAMSAPTLLVGLFIAGLLRAVVGPERIRRLMGGSLVQQLTRASLWATLTPVCSLGVLPIVRELRRAGVPAPPLVTYLLSAPMLNPITLVYGWTILEPPVFGLLVATTLAVSWGIGAVTSRWAARRIETNPADFPRGEWGLKRMANIGIAAGRSMAESTVWDLLIALGVSAVAASLQPTAWMSPWLHYTNLNAPWVMLLPVAPAYIDPYIGLMQVWAISSVQFSLAAGVILHVFGVGCNAAVVLWIARLYGSSRLASIGVMVLIVAMGVGYLADAVLPHPTGMEEDTHALDTLTRPYEAYHIRLDGVGWERFGEIAFRHVQPVFVICIGGVAAILAIGIVIRWRNSPFYSGEAAEAALRAQESSLWGRAIPMRWLALLGMAGAVGALALLTYIYYPPVGELFAEAKIVRTNVQVAVNTSNWELADRELSKLDVFLSKVPTSLMLRVGSVPEAARSSNESLRLLVNELRIAVNNRESEQAKSLVRQLADAARNCKESCLEGQP